MKTEKKQKKFHVRRGDTVKIIAGDFKGKSGKILTILTGENKAIVEGWNMVSRHTKPNANNPNGGITKKEAPIHISNLALVESSGESKKSEKKSEKKEKVKSSKK